MKDGSRNALRARAEAKAAERLKTLHGSSIFRENPAGYTRRPAQNLVPGVEVNDFWSDLGAGAGNELTDGARDPAKFCAAFSSSALAVNSFGPFRHHPTNLDLAGRRGFSEAQFEKPLPTGLRGTDPHLDFFAAGPSSVVCVESKFLEPLWPKEAKFARSYGGAIEALAESHWTTVYRELKINPKMFKFLDAAQLVKHYLGMRNTLGHLQVDQALLYVYWEPDNAAQIEAYVDHRNEVKQFAQAVSGGQIAFIARSYLQLWAEWQDGSKWDGIAKHIRHLEERYAFSI